MLSLLKTLPDVSRPASFPLCASAAFALRFLLQQHGGAWASPDAAVTLLGALERAAGVAALFAGGGAYGEPGGAPAAAAARARPSGAFSAVPGARTSPLAQAASARMMPPSPPPASPRLSNLPAVPAAPRPAPGSSAPSPAAAPPIGVAPPNAGALAPQPLAATAGPGPALLAAAAAAAAAAPAAAAASDALAGTLSARISGGAYLAGGVWALTALPSGHLATGCGGAGERAVRLWAAPSDGEAAAGEGACVAALPGHRGEVNGAAAIPGGGEADLATVSADKTVCLWNSRLPSLALVGSLKRHSRAVRAVVALSAGVIATAGDDGMLVAWDTVQLAPLAATSAPGAPPKPLHALAALRRGGVAPGTLAVLATGATDGCIRVYALKAGVFGRSLVESAALGEPRSARAPQPFAAVEALAELAPGFLAGGHVDGAITVWALSKRALAATLSGSGAAVAALAYLPDGRLAAGSTDGLVRLWDLAERACVATLSGHTGAVLTLAMTADGRLASGGDDGVLCLWK